MGEAESFPHEPISVFAELMKTTMTLATNLHVSPFEIFAQDCDDVIMLINFYLALGNEHSESGKSAIKPQTAKNGPNVRIRVNDKTATGGWY